MCDMSVTMNRRSNIDEAMAYLRTQHEEIIHKLDNVLNTFNGANETKAINQEDLMLFPIYEWVELNKDVWIRRRNDVFGDILNFDTIIKNGGGFGDHYHQWLLESCEVISGKIVDLNTKKEYFAGDIAEFDHEESHHIIADTNARLKVLFKKTNQTK